MAVPPPLTCVFFPQGDSLPGEAGARGAVGLSGKRVSWTLYRNRDQIPPLRWKIHTATNTTNSNARAHPDVAMGLVGLSPTELMWKMKWFLLWAGCE